MIERTSVGGATVRLHAWRFRGIWTLLGLAIGGFLVSLATSFDLDSTESFWYAMGVVAAAGSVLGLSQLLGGWRKGGRLRLSAGVLALGFLPTVVVAGWILVTSQPEGGWQRGRLAEWSDAIGVDGLIEDLGSFRAVVAFALGLVLVLVLETKETPSRLVTSSESPAETGEQPVSENGDLASYLIEWRVKTGRR